MNDWTRNIEYIFTEDELKDLVKSRHLEKLKLDKRNYYFKKGCKIDFLKFHKNNTVK